MNGEEEDMRRPDPRITRLALAFAVLPITADKLALRIGKEINGTFLRRDRPLDRVSAVFQQVREGALHTIATINFSEPLVVSPPPPQRPTARK
jgi:hypothetical protein